CEWVGAVVCGGWHRAARRDESHASPRGSAGAADHRGGPRAAEEGGEAAAEQVQAIRGSRDGKLLRAPAAWMCGGWWRRRRRRMQGADRFSEIFGDPAA